MTYSVKFKKVGSFFWKRIKNIKIDGFLTPQIPGTEQVVLLSYRWFVLDNGVRIEVPLSNIIFVFDKKRAEMIENSEHIRQQILQEQLKNAPVENSDNSEKRIKVAVEKNIQ